MTRTATTEDSAGRTITATLTSATEVQIDRDGVWSGTGTWDGNQIECTADFGDENDSIYSDLELGLME